MKIGYRNSDIDHYLKEKREKIGPMWYIVASFDKSEWQALINRSVNAIEMKLRNIVAEETKQILRITGAFSAVLNRAEEEHYKEAKLLKDFVHVCGDKIHPSMSLLEIPGDKLAVIFYIKRKTIKDNMSPRRLLDLGDG